ENEIVHASSRTGKYLELAEGAPSHKVTDLAKRGLRSAIRAALELARQRKRRALKRDVRVALDDDSSLLVDVVADPLGEDRILLVLNEAAHRGEPDGDG